MKVFTLNCPMCGRSMQLNEKRTRAGAKASAASEAWIAGCQVHGLFQLGPTKDVSVRQAPTRSTIFTRLSQS